MASAEIWSASPDPASSPGPHHAQSSDASYSDGPMDGGTDTGDGFEMISENPMTNGEQPDSSFSLSGSHLSNGQWNALSGNRGEKEGLEMPRIRPVKKDNDHRGGAQLDDSSREQHDVVHRRQRSGLRWAPLKVPLKRRLQTLVVLVHTISIALFVSIFFLLCATPIFWPLLLPYLLYVLLSRAGVSGELSYRSKFLRSLPYWSLFASYFPAQLHRSQILPSTRKYIFGYHPHGIISHGAFAAFATEALGFSNLFPGITNTLLTLDSNFRIPLYRDYALALGLASVSRESCENILSRGGADGAGMGRGITIVVGGARESLDAQPRSLRLVLKRRKGFIKLAIRTGADLVPVLAFGENELYDQVSPSSHPAIHKMQLLLKRCLGFTIPLFHARGVFNYDVGLLPYRRPLNIVVGRPIKVIRQLRPEESYVDDIHTAYVAELERIWEEWKDDFARDREEELQIVE